MRIHIFAVVTALPFLACNKGEPATAEPSAKGSASAAPTAAEQQAPKPEPVPVINHSEIIREKSSLADAIAYAKPQMIDKFDQSSDGTLLMNSWAMKMMTWKDINAAQA